MDDLDRLLNDLKDLAEIEDIANIGDTHHLLQNSSEIDLNSPNNSNSIDHQTNESITSTSNKENNASNEVNLFTFTKNRTKRIPSIHSEVPLEITKQSPKNETPNDKKTVTFKEEVQKKALEISEEINKESEKPEQHNASQKNQKPVTHENLVIDSLIRQKRQKKPKKNTRSYKQPISLKKEAIKSSSLPLKHQINKAIKYQRPGSAKQRKKINSVQQKKPNQLRQLQLTSPQSMIISKTKSSSPNIRKKRKRSSTFDFSPYSVSNQKVKDARRFRKQQKYSYNFRKPGASFGTNPREINYLNKSKVPAPGYGFFI